MRGEKFMSEKIDKMLRDQKQREDAEAQAMVKNILNLKDQKTQLAMELDAFLREQMPGLEPLQRLHLYQISEELRKKFVVRCIEKGLLQV
jgi:hypothetical protein